MCAICVMAVRSYFPDVSDKDMGAFLHAATCFPCGTPGQVEENLLAAREAGCRTGEEAMAYADHIMAMAERKINEAKEV